MDDPARENPAPAPGAEAGHGQRAAAAARTPAAPSDYAFRDMRLKVGDRAQVEPPVQSGGGRVSLRVVGWVEGRCLVLTGARLNLIEGETVTLRVFNGRSAFACRCSVLKKHTPASDYLELSFPGHVEGVEVRSSPRVRVDMPASVEPAQGEACAVRIDNIGITGALIDADKPLGSKGDALKVKFAFVLHEVPVSLCLDATVRSLQSDALPDTGTRHRHGVSFSEPAPNDRLVLASLVWFHTYDDPHCVV